jgi:hypothetical protein
MPLQPHKANLFCPLSSEAYLLRGKNDLVILLGKRVLSKDILINKKRVIARYEAIST